MHSLVATITNSCRPSHPLVIDSLAQYNILYLMPDYVYFLDSTTVAPSHHFILTIYIPIAIISHAIERMASLYLVN